MQAGAPGGSVATIFFATFSHQATALPDYLNLGAT
jgi:hypothetical protein